MQEIVKRDGTREVFAINKIENAIAKAMIETEFGIDVEILERIIGEVHSALETEQVSPNVECIQDFIEEALMQYRPDVAKRYIVYRNKRTEEREKGWEMTELQRSIWEKKYRYKDETFDEWLERVSGGNQRIKKRMRKKQFLFGGRILANRGLQKNGLKVTYSNCYVLPAPKDNIESIWGTAGDMARTYSFGGGVGISLRHIRPRDAKVHNNARTTSGAVSFMPLYSLTTETIGQNGRRGALMISIPSSHPDLEEFIDVKTKQGAITGANISIEIDDAFMFAVKKDEPYKLHFVVEDTGQVIERTVNAKSLYVKLVKNNLDWAEPGMLYWDRISNYHLMSAHPDFYFDGTNPCAEEPLPPGGSCLLGSLNLSEFVVAPFTERATFDFPSFIEAVHDAVIALNEVLDEGLPLHPLEIQKKTVGDLRQIGLGVMGISEMQIKLGITYGSTSALMINEVIASIMINEAVRQSSLIAKEKGSFNWYNWEHINNSAFFQEVITPEVQATVKENGLCNSQILCIAPTGSISTMLGVSGGIEPTFSLEYERTTKSLHGEDVTYTVSEPIVQQFREETGYKGELPEYFITSAELPWRNRIEMQAVWQKFIDASISSTVNLPEEASLEDTMDLYMYAWEMGLKGCTIYRANCKRAGILVAKSDKKKENKEEIIEQNEGERATGYYSKCPECGSEHMMVANGCVTCQDCGFSPC